MSDKKAPKPLEIIAERVLLDESKWTPSNTAEGHSRMMTDAHEPELRKALLDLIDSYRDPAVHSGMADGGVRAGHIGNVTAPKDLLETARASIRGRQINE